MSRGGFPEFVSPLTPVNTPVQRSVAKSPAAASRRILISRTIANGDILMGSPLLAALRVALPDAHLTWIVERREREAVDASPFIDELLLWDTPFWKGMTRTGLYPLFWGNALKLRRLLQERNYDTFISLQPEDWSLLPRIVSSKTRIGVFDTFRQYHGTTRTSARTRLYTHSFTEKDLPGHRTDQYLLPLQALGIPVTADKRLYIGFTREDEEAAGAFLSTHNLQRFVMIAPVTGWPSRNWPHERYAALGDALARRHDCATVLIGGPGDREAVERVAAGMTTKPVIAAGAFGFRTMAAVLARASLLISGDTGPMHAAAAVGTPFLALFGPTPTQDRVPLVGVGRALAHSVPCGPCDKKRCGNTGDDVLLCLRLITVDEALSAAADLLTGSGRQPLPMLPV
ncbi:MAG: glycosyltransferase family 9 protein [Armatimonadota bacterium]